MRETGLRKMLAMNRRRERRHSCRPGGLRLGRADTNVCAPGSLPQCAALAFGVPLLLLLASGCTTPESKPRLDRYEYSSPHMGTLFSITLYAPSEAQAELAAQAAFDRIAQLEDGLSDYMADSELMRLSAASNGTAVRVSADLFTVLQRGAQISAETEGAFDLTCGPLTRLWRFSRKRGALPSDSDLAAARAAVDWRTVLLDPNAQTVTLTLIRTRLDAGGIAKGYAADEALKVLNTCGIQRALVAASGDIRAGLPPPGKEGWTVTIADFGTRPKEPGLSGWVEAGGGTRHGSNSRYGGAGVGLFVVTPAPASGRELVPQTLLVRNAAISTSGDTEQFVEIDGVRYSHIVSPFTGLGLTNRIQVTVIAPDATTSDALATACCVLGPERAIRVADSIPGGAVIVVTEDGNQTRTWRSKRAP